MATDRTRLFDLVAQVAHAGDDPSTRDETLELITRAAKESITHAHSVSISVSENGNFTTLVATDDLSSGGDKLQRDLDEGPCVDAAGGEPIARSGDLYNDSRWPRYGPRAFNELGVVSQIAFEMYSGDRSYGGLNLYSLTRGAFNDDESMSLAEMFASQAAVVMGRTATVQQLNHSLVSRKVIGQAVGLIMERYGLDEHRAFQFLVRISSTGNVKLRKVAEEIVAAANEKHASE